MSYVKRFFVWLFKRPFRAILEVSRDPRYGVTLVLKDGNRIRLTPQVANTAKVTYAFTYPTTACHFSVRCVRLFSPELNPDDSSRYRLRFWVCLTDHRTLEYQLDYNFPINARHVLEGWNIQSSSRLTLWGFQRYLRAPSHTVIRQRVTGRDYLASTPQRAPSLRN